MMFGKVKNVFFVGIGGIGMSGIAELLLNSGFGVAGSDLAPSKITDNLAQRGAVIYSGHAAENLGEADVLVYSSAVNKENPEVIEARNRNIPVISRAEMLAELLKLKPTSIAVGGTHGKTTTTSLLGTVLTEAGLDPTLVVGGIVKSLNVNAILGKGDIIVAEADEFDRSFLHLTPTYAIITTVDHDHMECYEDENDLIHSFAQFANAVPFYGAVSVCMDDPLIKKVIPLISRPLLTSGLSDDADFTVNNIRYEEVSTTFDVLQNGTILGTVTLQIPGQHNVTNALTVIALCLEIGMQMDVIAKGMNSFTGVRRRFEIKGVFDEIMVVDDYAHHPTEVSATLKAVREGWNRRIIAVFQPHLFSRTRDFYHEFASVLTMADCIVITDIYPAREKPIDGITGKLIADKAASLGHDEIHWIPDKTEIPITLQEIAKSGDIIITMGAGDIWKMGDEFITLMGQETVTA